MSRLALSAGLALVLAACGSPSVPSDRPSLAATTSLTPGEPSPPPQAQAPPEPGRPFDAEAILAAMRDSRRPGGVPAALQQEAIARSVAEAIWTIDGEPWRTIAVGASCGSARCVLELAGAPGGRVGDDAWVFDVDPSSGAVELVTADLHALPGDLVERLDVMTRAADRAGLLDGLVLASARWLPPPEPDRFVLSYRSGDEERSCARDVTLDAARGEVVRTTSTGC